MQTQATVPERLIKLPEVCALSGLGKSSIYAGMKAGTFPKCYPVGPRGVRWKESEVRAWVSTPTPLPKRDTKGA